MAPTSPYNLITLTGSVQPNVTFAASATFQTTVAGQTALQFSSTTASFVLSGKDLNFTGSISKNFEGTISNWFSGRQQTINNNINTGAAQVGIQSAGTGSILTLGGNITMGTGSLGLLGSAGTIQVNGVISGDNTIYVNGSATGITELNNANTYTGGTAIYTSIVKVNNAAALGNSTTAVQMGSGGGNFTPTLLTNGAITLSRNIFLASTGANAANTYTLGGSTADISTFSGNVDLQTDSATKLAENLTVTAVAGGRVNFTGNFVRAALSTGTSDTLTKTGAGIVALSGTVNNQGANTVSVGTLLVNGTLATGGADVNVDAAATLGGTGTINRSVSIDAGGILSAGDMLGSTSLAGTLTLGAGTTSGLTLANTSEIKFDLKNGDFTLGVGINDLITVDGQLTLDGTLRVTELGGSLTNGTYCLFTYTGALTDNTLVIDAAFLAAHVGSTIDTSVANQINLQVVPEPSTWALLALGLTTVMLLRQRRSA